MDTSVETNRDQLAAELLPLVYRVAGRIARHLPPHVSFDDLVAAGMLGLASALERFDPARAERFKGYAEYRIRGEILDELRRLDSLSRDARFESRRVQETIRDLSGKLGRAVGADEVAMSLGVSLEEYRSMELQLQQPSTISMELTEIEIPGEGSDPFRDRALGEARERLIGALDCLPQNQRTILWLYYYEELPLREIAEIFDVTPSRICQIRGDAVRRLRIAMDSEESIAA